MLTLLRNNAVADPEKLLLELIDEQQAKFDQFLKGGNLKHTSQTDQSSLKPNKVRKKAHTFIVFHLLIRRHKNSKSFLRDF